MTYKLNLLLLVVFGLFYQASFADESDTQGIQNSSSVQSESLIGEWDLYLPTPIGIEKVLAKFAGEIGSYTGVIEGKKGRKALKNVEINGNDFAFQRDIEKLFMTFTIDFSGKVDGGKLTGVVNTPKGSKAFKGVRRDI